MWLVFVDKVLRILGFFGKYVEFESLLEKYLLKKLLSISLLFCFALYHFGHYVFYFTHQVQVENTWSEKIYAASNEIELEERLLEVPLAAPYMANEQEFRATNTRFEKDGQFFRAIKQRYQNDTLQIVYVADTSRQKLENTFEKWVSWLTEGEMQQESSKTISLKVFVKDYIQQHFIEFTPIQELVSIEHLGFIFSTYTSPFFQLDTPPPQIS